MKVAVLGATGAVGRTMLRVLEERMPAAEAVVPLASARSAGAVVRWRGRDWRVEAPAPGVFRGCRVALFSAGGALSREWAPVAAGEGAVVVDNSSAWRMDPQVPLVVPEVNGDRAADRPKGIIANPNCSTIQLVLPLEAFRRTAGLARVVVSTYQSVSGAGQKGLRAYRAELEGGTDPESPFPARIVGNVIPRIGGARPGGWTEEEEKMRAETRKILGLPALPVVATCVRVPVRVGHSVSAMIELERDLAMPEAEAALRAMPGVELVADQAPDPVPDQVAGTDVVRVGRLRRDPDQPNVYHMWIVADNLRKGAATNAVQIADLVADG
jgi:aspartate-semialdehyde dehydrogenase